MTVRSLNDLPTPCLLVDLDVLERNLDRMARRATDLGVSLRPHVKTHKCVEIARLQEERGARGFTVSTLEEARAFGEAGFRDLTWAFPVILGRLDEAVALASEMSFGLVVDSPQAVEALKRSGAPFTVWLKVDCGYHRAGVDPLSPQAQELASALASSHRLRFAGLLSHSGHAYKVRGSRELARVAEEERQVMTRLAETLRSQGIDPPGVSVGSTPAMSAVRSLSGVTEARPGNYAYHDLTQVGLGSCRVEDCALTVLASVVSSQPGNPHSVVDAGALALSKDPGLSSLGKGSPAPLGRESWGAVFADYATSTLSQESYVTSLSQEHGEVRGRFAVGSRLRILPNHSCLTAACFDDLFAVRGERVEGRWRIHRQR
jgi:D-serine deaminase-like pyridoxal phosphate-dependent protein